jgi:hypothetical protein
MERTVSFISVDDISCAVDSDVLYIGDMKYRKQYQSDGNIHYFVSLSHLTHIIAPLLVLSEVPTIHIQDSSGNGRITIRMNHPILDIDERIDDFLHRFTGGQVAPHTVPQLYREIIGNHAEVHADWDNGSEMM